MADWKVLPDSALDPDAPVTSELAYAWRDNPIAIAEGAVGAPRISPFALPLSATSTSSFPCLPSTTLNVTSNVVPVFYAIRGGTVRITATTSPASISRVLYLGGVAVYSGTGNIDMVLTVQRTSVISISTTQAGGAIFTLSAFADQPTFAIGYAK